MKSKAVSRRMPGKKKALIDLRCGLPGGGPVILGDRDEGLGQRTEGQKNRKAGRGLIEEIWMLLRTRGDFFGELLLEHIRLSLVSIGIAMVLGLLIGVLIGEFRRSAKPVMGLVNLIYTIPSISLLGFLIPFSGIGDTTAMIALTVYALLPMVRNSYTGLTTINPLLIEAATGMGSTRFQVLIKIKLPLAMPMILTGIRSMAVMTIALGGIASFIGAGGLGVAIYRGITTNNKAMTVTGSLMIALLALAVDGLIGGIEKRRRKTAA